MHINTHHAVNLDFLTRGTVFGHKGYISASWDDLVNEFGFPLKSKEPFATVEWQISIVDGKQKTFLTIYDLHAKCQREDLTVWAVGGIRGAEVFKPLAKLGFKQHTRGVLYG